MKKSRISKVIGLVLLIVFTLQVSDLTCIGDSLSLNTPGTYGENQHITAELNKGKTAPPAVSLNQCQCPCHLSFTHAPSTEANSYRSICLSLLPAGEQALKEISTDIFQPPKVLI